MIVSVPQWVEFLEHSLSQIGECRNGQNPFEYWNDTMANYNTTDGIPKSMLFVKLDPEISDDRRAFIANGLRNFFIN